MPLAWPFQPIFALEPVAAPNLWADVVSPLTKSDGVPPYGEAPLMQLPNSANGQHIGAFAWPVVDITQLLPPICFEPSIAQQLHWQHQAD